MLLIYNLGLRAYYALILFFSLFNKKAAQWINGRRHVTYAAFTKSIWFHFASLGEFEQGRPVLERLKAQYPQHKIVITFFSPSGYEIRKDTPLADAVYYLPLDTPGNAREFISAIDPMMAVFTKYEYWYHFFKALHQRDIPLYIISGIFRPKQVFFKFYGGLHRKILSFVSHFFVQDEASKQLLASINITNVTVSGDTRFDRVWANARQPKDLPLISRFRNGHDVFIAGSTWPPDEQLIAPLAAQYPDRKFIIAPHEIGEERVAKLMQLFADGTAIRYSDIVNQNETIATWQVLVIDNIGMLSSLYQYGDIGYIGGGFGVGIHNTLEAAAFGLPVIFGPNYDKFKEAKDLIKLGAGFSVVDATALQTIVARLVGDQQYHASASKVAANYVADQVGATNTIVNYIVSV